MSAVIIGNGIGLLSNSLNETSYLQTASSGQAPSGLRVNAATGNLVLQAGDQFVTSSGRDAAMVRTYNSQGLWQNQQAWRYFYQRELLDLGGSAEPLPASLRLRHDDGSEFQFNWDVERELYVTTDGDNAHDTLRFDTESQRWIYKRDGQKSEDIFDRNGRLVAQNDGYGQLTTFHYENDRLAEIRDASGQTISLNYIDTSRGYQISSLAIQSQAGEQYANATETTHYRYDQQGRLIETLIDLSPSDGSITDGNLFFTRLTYHGDSDRISRVSHSDGSAITIDYQQYSGESTDLIQDGTWLVARVSDNNGYWVDYDYDPWRQMTHLSDQRGRVTTYQYNQAGQILRVTLPEQSGKQAYLAMTYDDDGNLTERQDELGQVTRWSYDENGNVTLIQSANGDTSEYQYNEKNSLIKETVYLQADPDGAGLSPALEPRHNFFVRDENDFLRFQINHVGEFVEYQYNAKGEVAAELAWHSHRLPEALLGGDDISLSDVQTWINQQSSVKVRLSENSYDFRGQLATVATFQELQLRGQTPQGASAVQRFSYDVHGQLILSQDAVGGVSHFAYDGLGRVVASTDPLGHTTQFHYDDGAQRHRTQHANGLIVSQWLDQGGRVIKEVIDEGGAERTTEYLYDNAGRVRIKTNTNGSKEYYFYDALNNKTGHIDAKGHLSRWHFNARGDLFQVSQLYHAIDVSTLVDEQGQIIESAWDLSALADAAESANDRHVYYLYDQAGDAVMTIDNLGSVTQYIDDAQGKPLREVRYEKTIDTELLTVNTQVEEVLAWLNDSVVLTVANQEVAVVREPEQAYLYSNEAYNQFPTQTAETQRVVLVPQASYRDPVQPYTLAAGAYHYSEARTEVFVSAEQNYVNSTQQSLTFPAADYDGDTLLFKYRPIGSEFGFYETEVSAVNGNFTVFFSSQVGQDLEIVIEHQADDNAPVVIGQGSLQLLNAGDSPRQVNVLYTEIPRVATLISGSSLSDYVPSALWSNIAKVSTKVYLTDSETVREDINNLPLVSHAMTYPADNIEAPAWINLTNNSMPLWDGRYQIMVTIETLDGQLLEQPGFIYEIGLQSASELTTQVSWPVGDIDLPINRLAYRSAYRNEPFKSIDVQREGDWYFAAIPGYSSGESLELKLIHESDKVGHDGKPLEYHEALGIITVSDLAQAEDFTFVGETIYTGETEGSALLDVIPESDWALIDSIQVDIYRDSDNAWIGRTFTYPRAFPNYDGQINLTTEGTLDDGRYRLVLNTYRNDGSSTETAFIYELGDQVSLENQHRISADFSELDSNISVYFLFPDLGADYEAIELDANGQWHLDWDTYFQRFYPDQALPDGLYDLAIQYRSSSTGVVLEEFTSQLRADLGQYAFVLSDRGGNEQLAYQHQQYFYDDAGRLAGELANHGQVTTYTYDNLGQLTQTTTYAEASPYHGVKTELTLAELVATITPSSLDKTEYYFYNGSGQQIGFIDSLGYLTAQTLDAGGRVAASTQYETAVDGLPKDWEVIQAEMMNAPSRKTIYQYDANGQVVETSDWQGLRTRYDYNSRGQVKRVRYDDEQGQTLQRQTLKRYDKQGRVVAEVGGEGANQIHNASTDAQREALWEKYASFYHYNSDGLLQYRFRFEGDNQEKVISEYNVYDENRQKRFVLDATGAISEVAYNAFGEVEKSAQYALAIPVDLLLSFGDNEKNLQFLENFVAMQSEWRGEVLAYDSLGRIVQEQNTLGQVKNHRYDSYSRLVESELAYVGDTEALLTTTYEYNKQNLATQHSETSAFGTTVDLAEYDTFGRLITKTDVGGQSTRFEYDARGRQIAVIQADGALYQQHYDAFDRVITETDPLGHTKTYQFDDTNRTLTLVQSDGSQQQTKLNVFGETLVITDALGTEKRYQYNRLGQVVTVERWDANGERLGVEEQSVYGAHARLVEFTDARGLRHEYQYDVEGKLTETISRDGTVVRSETITYDAFDNVILRVDQDGVTNAMHYDEKGQLLRTVVSDGEGNLQENHFEYDHRGNQVRHIVGVPNSSMAKITEYRFDEKNRLIEEIVDPDGQAASTRYAYNDYDQVWRKTLASGDHEYLVYDEHGLGQVRFTVSSLGQVEANAYDAKGQIEKTTRYALAIDTDGLAQALENHATPTRVIYERLAARELMPGNQYQGGGQQTEKDQVKISIFDEKGLERFAIDDAGRLVESRFDANGRRTAMIQYQVTLDADEWIYGDAKPTLEQITELTGDLALQGARVERFQYNALDQVVARIDASGSVTLYERDYTGQITRETQLAGRTESPEQALVNGTLGQAIALSELPTSSEDRTMRFAYNAFGQQTHRVDSMGHVTKLHYAPSGEVIETIQYALPIALNSSDAATIDQALVEHGNDRHGKVLYDKLGRKRFALDAANVLQEWRYDERGRVSQWTSFYTTFPDAGAINQPDWDLQSVESWTAGLSAYEKRNNQALYYTYNAKDQVIAKRDHLNRRITMAYDAMGNKVYEQQANGAATWLDFDSQGQLTREVKQINDKEAVVKDFTYYDFGKLATAIHYSESVNIEGLSSNADLSQIAVVTNENTIDGDRRKAYFYDNDQRLSAEVQYYHALEGEILNEKRNETFFMYDDFGQLIEKIDSANTQQEARTQFQYDSLGRIIAETKAAGEAYAQTTRFAYNAFGEKVASTSAMATALTQRDDAWALDLRQRMGFTLIDQGYERAKFYNELSADEISQIENLYTSTQVFDKRGRLVENHYAGTSSFMRYDAADNLIQTTNAAGATQDFLYNSAGQQIAVIDALGFITLKSFDSRGLETGEYRYQKAIVRETVAGLDSLEAIQAQLADDAGQSIISVEKVYDRAGQLTQVIDDLGNAERYFYDRFGNKTRVIDRNGNVKTMSYDMRNQLVESRVLGVSIVTDTDSVRTETVDLINTYEYDDLGNRIRVTEAVGLAQENTRDFVYDKLGQVIKEIQAPQKVFDVRNETYSFERPVQQYEYDAAGNLVKAIDAAGNDAHFHYDALGRKTLALSGAGVLQEWRYDAQGNLVQHRAYDEHALHHDLESIDTVRKGSQFREENFVYNALNQKIARYTQLGYFYQLGEGLYQTAPETRYEYNLLGKLSHLTDPRGNTNRLLYNARGENVLSIDALGYATRNEFDSSGQVIASTQYATPLNASILAAIDNGAETDWVLTQLTDSAEDRKVLNAYDSLGRIVETRQLGIRTSGLNSSNDLFQGIYDRVEQFNYDKVGNQTQIRHGAMHAGTANWTGDTRTSDLTYDKLNRVTSETKNAFRMDNGLMHAPKVLRYYDALGNLVVEAGQSASGNDEQVDSSDQVKRYYYDAQKRLFKTKANNGHTVLYDHDVMGHQVRKRSQQYYFDYAMNDTNSSMQTRWIAEHFYFDADGRLEYHLNGERNWQYRYNGHNDVVAKGSEEGFQEYYHYNRFGQIEKSNKGGQEHFFMYDENGNLTLQADSNGAEFKETAFRNILSLDRLAPGANFHITINRFDALDQVIETIEPELEFLRAQNGLPGLGNTHPIEFQGGNIKGSSGASFTAKAHLYMSYRRKKGPKVNFYQYGMSFNWSGLSDYNGKLKIDWQSNFAAGKTEGSHVAEVGDGGVVIDFRNGNPFSVGHRADGNYTLHGVKERGFMYSAKVYKQNANGEWEYFRALEGSYGWDAGLPAADKRKWSARHTTEDQRHVPALLTITEQPEDTTRVSLYYRRAGSSGSYQKQVAGLTSAGVFAVDIEDITTGQYEYYYLSTNSEGVVINAAQGNLTLDNQGRISLTHGEMAMPEVPEESIINTAFREYQELLGNAVVKKQRFNAFGETIAQVDGRGNTTQVVYNKAGEVVKKILPRVAVTESNGYRHNVTPESSYFYDQFGRQIATLDAKGHMEKQRYEGELLTQSIFADGSTMSYSYNDFGQKVRETNAINQATTFQYDKAGNVITVNRVSNYDDYYVYNEKGQRIRHRTGYRLAGTNAIGTAFYSYDRHDRMTRAMDFSGDITHTQYEYDASIGGIGGYKSTQTMANGRTKVAHYDYFDRLVYRRDMGYNEYHYGYNENSGYLTEQNSSTGQEIYFAYYSNGLKKQIDDLGVNSYGFYDYDKNYNLIVEEYSHNTEEGGVLLSQRNQARYDSHNRITQIRDSDLMINYEWDRVGNRVRAYSRYRDNSVYQQDLWYKYDERNRFTITKGELSNGRGRSISDTSTGIVKGSGYEISYDALGRRASAESGLSKEEYTYTSQGWLSTIKIDGNLRSRRSYYQDGRIRRVQNYKSVENRYFRFHDDAGRRLANGVYYGFLTAMGEWVSESEYKLSTDTTYNYNKQGLTSYEYQRTLDKNGQDEQQTKTWSYYDKLGNVNSTRTFTRSKNDGQWSDQTINTRYSYFIQDGYKKDKVEVRGSTSQDTQWKWGKGLSDLSYDANGNLLKAVDHYAGRIINYVNNHDGRVLKREEEGTEGNRYQRYFYFNGRGIGDVGNEGPGYIDYTRERELIDNADKNKNDSKPVFSADFDASYLPVSGSSALSVGRYTVRANESFQAIALVLWGDATQWYLLAEANGLSGSEPLTAGQVLLVPNVVVNSANNTDSYRPYDAARALGNTSPTLPAMPPPPAEGPNACAIIGIIVMIAVTVVASVLTAGALAGPGASLAITMLAGAVGGAVGSVAGQLVGMAFGVVDKFSWKDVAVGAITGAFAAGISEIGGLKAAAEAGGKVNAAVDATTKAATKVSLLAKAGKAALRGMGNYIGSIYAHQLVGSDKEKFTWRGLLSAGLGGAAGGALTGFDKGVDKFFKSNIKSKFFGEFLSGATRNLVSGTATGLIDHFVVDKGRGGFDFAGVAMNAAGKSLGNATATSIQHRIAEIKALNETEIVNAAYENNGNDPKARRQARRKLESLLATAESANAKNEAAGAILEHVNPDDLIELTKLSMGTKYEAYKQEFLEKTSIDLEDAIRNTASGKAKLLNGGAGTELQLGQNLEKEMEKRNFDRYFDHVEDIETLKDAFLAEGSLPPEEFLDDRDATYKALKETYGIGTLEEVRFIENKTAFGKGAEAAKPIILAAGQLMESIHKVIDHPLTTIVMGAMAIAAGPVKFALNTAFDLLVGDTQDHLIGTLKEGAAFYLYDKTSDISIRESRTMINGIFGLGSLIFRGVGGAKRGLKSLFSKNKHIAKGMAYKRYAEMKVGKLDRTIKSRVGEELGLSTVTTSSFKSKAPDPKYGSIPAEHQARYDRYLDRSPKKVLSPDEWYKKAQTIWKNNSKGNGFEQTVRMELKVPLGKGSKPVKIGGHIPDMPVGKKWGVTDIKDVEYLTNTDQLKAFHNYAKENNMPFNLIVSPKTNQVSAPVLDQIRSTNGRLYEYDVTNQVLKTIDIGKDGLWKR